MKRRNLLPLAVVLALGLTPPGQGAVQAAEVVIGVLYPLTGPVAQVGIEWATRQCTNLLRQQVRGIHFYTLNQSDATKRIYTNLGTADRPSLAKAS